MSGGKMDRERAPLIRDLRIGIVGYGTVGRALAKRLRAVDLSVVTVDPAVEGETPPHFAALAELPPQDVLIACVPTPEGAPLSVLEGVVAEINALQNPPNLVIAESTLPPGGYRRLRGLLPIGVAFAYCPERHNPGGAQSPARVVGCDYDWITWGDDWLSPAVVCEGIYRMAGWRVVRALPEEAELAKLLENAQRAVLIGFAAQFAARARELGVDPWRVFELAETKGVGYAAARHSAGVGGLCISTVPRWLIPDNEIPALVSALDTIAAMPAAVAFRAKILAAGVPAKDRMFALVGCGYKPGVVGGPNPPADMVARHLGKASVWCYDPAMPVHDHDPTVATKLLRESSVVIYLQPQPQHVADMVMETSRKILDCTGTLPWHEKVERL